MAYSGAEPKPVIAGGTGKSSFTAYAVICGGITSQGALQSIASVGTAGQVLTSNGAAALPTFQSAAASGAVLSVGVDAHTAPGTSPVLPTVGGLVTITGAQVASGTVGANVIRTDSLAANTLTIEIQRTTTAAATDSTKNGVAHFDSADFTVDTNGFVSAATTGFVKTLTGDSGGAIPPSSNNIGVVGGSTAAGTSPVAVAGATNTLTVNVQKSQAIAATDATKVGLAAFDSASFAVDANGFVTASATGVIKTITGNSGGAESPSAGNFNILGTGSITVAGTANTETVQLTGLTNHALQVGAGTATLTQLATTATAGQVLQSAGSSSDPAYSTATYPSTTTVSQILYSSATNVVSGLATANRAVVTTSATGVPVVTALATDGQLIIGSTAGAPAAATLTAGTGITITNASNSITVAVTGGGNTWSSITANQTLVVNNGYFVTSGTLSLALPAAAVVGDTIYVVLRGGTSYSITQASGQQIFFGNTNTTSGAGGSLASSAAGDSIRMVCSATNTTWVVIDSVGNLTVT